MLYNRVKIVNDKGNDLVSCPDSPFNEDEALNVLLK